MQKKYLITGGAGFIGSHICRNLIQDGHKVICIDNLITGREKNIKDIINSKNFKFIKHDISNPFFIKDSIDYVFHFASIASPKDYFKNPIKTLKSGSMGTHNCLGIAKQKKAVFVLASTSEIYGDPEVHPQKETYWGHVNPVGPRGCYDESKRFAESITVAYQNTHGVNTKIIRIFNTYGPYMKTNDGRVMPAFITQALNNKDLTIFGDGSQTRSFCYIDDMVEGIKKISQLKENTIVNLGNPDELTIKQLAFEIITALNSKSSIKYMPALEDEPKRRKPDISKAIQLANFQLKTDLKDGIKKTSKWFQKNP